MATYVIGDLQGCYQALLALLKQIDYQPEDDHLWFVGDIVNRGPQSLECLRFVKDTCEAGRGKMVLGNHDFHLLAAYAGLKKYVDKSDTLAPILSAPDCDELIDWLRKQPLLVKHDFLPVVMVHAGIPPQWTIPEALNYANEISTILKMADWQKNLKTEMFGNNPKIWHDYLTGWDRVRYIVNALVRMRFCNSQGALEFKQKMAPSQATNKSFAPWFVHSNRKNKDHEIFFGHWSTLGSMDGYQVHSTDTGCLWGGQLTAYCLETKKRHEYSCQPNAPITHT